MVDYLLKVRENAGRLFILGVGGSAANASHAVNDFRKLCGIEAYAPTDNVAELTARTNDDGWETVFSEWLKVSKFSKKDAARLPDYYDRIESVADVLRELSTTTPIPPPNLPAVDRNGYRLSAFQVRGS